MVKEELYRGSGLGTIRELAVDPDGRFVLALTDGEMGLVQLSLKDMGPNGPAMASVLTLEAVPELQQVSRLYPAQHNTAGRMYLMDPALNSGVLPKAVVVFDDDNDGVFQDQLVLSPEEFDGAFPPGSFSDFFVHYR
jgi:hypothetical protein